MARVHRPIGLMLRGHRRQKQLVCCRKENSRYRGNVRSESTCWAHAPVIGKDLVTVQSAATAACQYPETIMFLLIHIDTINIVRLVETIPIESEDNLHKIPCIPALDNRDFEKMGIPRSVWRFIRGVVLAHTGKSNAMMAFLYGWRLPQRVSDVLGMAMLKERRASIAPNCIGAREMPLISKWQLTTMLQRVRSNVEGEIAMWSLRRRGRTCGLDVVKNLFALSGIWRMPRLGFPIGRRKL